MVLFYPAVITGGYRVVPRCVLGSVHHPVVLDVYKRQVLDTSYAEEDYAIGMAKGSALEDAVNKALEELKADGTLQAIVDKYINAN